MPSLSKPEAEYRDYPKGGKCCGLCSMFIRPRDDNDGRCTLVKGEVMSYGWCVHFHQRKGTAS